MGIFTFLRWLLTRLALIGGASAFICGIALIPLTFGKGGGGALGVDHPRGFFDFSPRSDTGGAAGATTAIRRRGYYLFGAGEYTRVSPARFWTVWCLELAMFGGGAMLLAEVAVEGATMLLCDARGLPTPKSAVLLCSSLKRKCDVPSDELRLLWSEPYRLQIRRLPRVESLFSWIPRRVVMVVFAFTAVMFAVSAAAQYAVGQLHRAVAGLWSFAAIWLLVVVIAGAVALTCYLSLVLAPAGVFIWRGKLLLEKPSASLNPDEIDRVVVEFPERGYGIAQVHTRKGIRTVGIPAGTSLAELRNFLGEKVSVAKEGLQ